MYTQKYFLLFYIICVIFLLHSGENNYLIPCWFCKFTHLKKEKKKKKEVFIIFMVGLF